MIVSTNWLKDFVDIDISPNELADILTMLGLEVEGVVTHGEGLDDVVVAVVLEKEQHPNADKLSLCKVKSDNEILSIVCGASNFQVGDKVALAKIGTVLPGDFKIKRSKIRGEESYGMLCSEKELGLASESDGIMILPSDFQIGSPVFEALGIKDTIFEIGLTPNRADCLSIIGIAREVAAKLKKSLSIPHLTLNEDICPISNIATINVIDADLCPRYAARYISGCNVTTSPKWLVDRLQSVGLRSINNVVDVTNYVLMEYGHPLHAFDFDNLADSRVIVRRANDGEEFTTLDGQKRILNNSDLTIQDGEKVIALAGIMGGENSEISDKTQNILLESAYFKPSAIRLTSRRLGLHTESSHRFERGADINIVPEALNRAAILIAELSGGKIASGIIDIYPVINETRKIILRMERVNKVLGVTLTIDKINDLLISLGFEVEIVSSDLLSVAVPSFRVDIEREIDLVEEVARLYGFENIPASIPYANILSELPSLHQMLERKVREIFIALGFNEVINFSFISPDGFDKINLSINDIRRNFIPLRNPIVDEHSIMRTTLLPSLLKTVSDNYSHRILNQRIFEVRRVYIPINNQELPDEPLHIAGVLTGRRYPEGWNQDNSMVDFFDLKGCIEHLLLSLNIKDVHYSNEAIDNFYHPGKTCSLKVGNEQIGAFGELHPDVLIKHNILQPVLYFEVYFEQLMKYSNKKSKLIVPPRFPDVTRDVAMLVGDNISADDILNTVRKLSIKEIEDVAVFDVYQGEHVPNGMTSIAVRIRYRNPGKTLTDEEVAALHKIVIESLLQQHSIIIR